MPSITTRPTMMSNIFTFTFAIALSLALVLFLLVPSSYTIPTSSSHNVLARRSTAGSSRDALFASWDALLAIAYGEGYSSCSDFYKDTNYTVPSGVLCSSGTSNDVVGIVVTNVTNPLTDLDFPFQEMMGTILVAAEGLNVTEGYSYECIKNGYDFFFSSVNMESEPTVGFLSIEEIVSYCEESGQAI